MRFRKKPVEIEAVRWDGSLKSTVEVLEFVGSDGLDRKIRSYPLDRAMFINTLEGEMKASEGDWIIKGIQGEFYPCNPDIFDETYEAVE